MAKSSSRVISVRSVGDLLASFFVDLPEEYRHEPTRLQIHPIEYFRPHLRVPTPPNSTPYSYLILQRTGEGTVEINAERVTIRSRAAMFVHRGSVVSLRALRPTTTGWMIMYDDASIARVLHPEIIERLMACRAPIPLSPAALRWLEGVCRLLEQQTAIESGEHQPVSHHLFGAIIERLLAEAGKSAPPRADRAASVNRKFRALVFDHAVEQGSVSFYARKIGVSENHLLRCVGRLSGRSPKEWIIDVRLLHAQKLLRVTDLSISDVAARSGFEDPSYFGRQFRRRFGMSPKAFRMLPEQDSSG